MTARAEAAQRTRERILRATSEVFFERPGADISLDEIAERAGVSVRTVIRRFGAKEDLLAAAAEWASERITTQRDTAPVGDIPGAVVVLVQHYEDHGDGVIRMLAAEHEIPALGQFVADGRRVHRDWCRRVFGPYIQGDQSWSERRLAQFVAICDVYTWKLLRRDCGLSRTQTEQALIEILTPLTQE